ncbi:uncharacterized protein LOC120346526 isoform X1 [Styela clava]
MKFYMQYAADVLRLCCLQACVHQVLCNGLIVELISTSPLELRDIHFALIQNLVKMLKPIEIGTDYLGGEKYVSISGVIPFFKVLSQTCLAKKIHKVWHYSKQDQDFDPDLIEIWVCFRPKLTSYDMSITTWLNPSYKMCYFKKLASIRVPSFIVKK